MSVGGVGFIVSPRARHANDTSKGSHHKVCTYNYHLVAKSRPSTAQRLHLTSVRQTLIYQCLSVTTVTNPRVTCCWYVVTSMPLLHLVMQIS